MTLSDRIQQLINQNDTSQSELEKKLGFGKGTISKWKGSTAPAADKLQKIAEHFGVTVDYLLTGNTGNDSEHYYANEETREIAQEIFENPDLRSLFHAARDLTPERLKAHIDFMQSLKQQEEKHNDEGC